MYTIPLFLKDSNSPYAKRIFNDKYMFWDKYTPGFGVTFGMFGVFKDNWDPWQLEMNEYANSRVVSSICNFSGRPVLRIRIPRTKHPVRSMWSFSRRRYVRPARVILMERHVYTELPFIYIMLYKYLRVTHTRTYTRSAINTLQGARDGSLVAPGC